MTVLLRCDANDMVQLKLAHLLLAGIVGGGCGGWGGGARIGSLSVCLFWKLCSAFEGAHSPFRPVSSASAERGLAHLVTFLCLFFPQQSRLRRFLRVVSPSRSSHR